MLKKLKKILTFWRRKRVLVVVRGHYDGCVDQNARREAIRKQLEEEPQPILILEPGDTAFYLHG